MGQGMQEIISLKNIRKTYDLGKVKIEVLKGLNATINKKRIRCHYGTFRFGQKYADEYPGLFR